MKAKASSSSSGGGGGDGMNGSITEKGALRSASEKEKTKMRERQRRAITTKIFTGLRKHGGYNLPPRSDINDVLRQLAREAGWFIEPDGTTYRIQNHHQHLSAANPRFNTTTTTTTTPTTSSLSQQQQLYYYYCSNTSGTPTPTSSFGGGSGECSTTASPHHHHSTPAPLLPPPPPVGSLNNQAPDNQIFSPTTAIENGDGDNGVHPIPVYFGMPNYYNNNCDMGINTGQIIGTTTTNTAEISSMEMPQPLSNLQQLYYFQQQQHEDHRETLTSNLNTPIASPQHQSSTLA
ncbi:hypothetical protein MKW98_010001 [Papaver atlanticum]|uniref:Protein BZR1 homolog n=1 Tax=Papaver atlanticum TaxID=357466 RepID=A0AAD4RX97_9MAGN|nr:hypothetical protein MKW98_010001 [Papaver atlanticum]